MGVFPLHRRDSLTVPSGVRARREGSPTVARFKMSCSVLNLHPPAGVGKTTWKSHTIQAYRKHPHGRGEDGRRDHCRQLRTETPPRAWGRPVRSLTPTALRRNTPTGVGKTLSPHPRLPASQKHPHGRGEDYTATIQEVCARETPPRAWGRRRCKIKTFKVDRNTPTGVGKTMLCGLIIRRERKHPHGRGEDYIEKQSSYTNKGNTPTGVGKTAATEGMGNWIKKHPHGRGED